MRALFVIDGLGTGGAQRSLAELLPCYVERGVEPVVVCLAHKDEGVEADVVSSGFDVRFLAGPTFVHRLVSLRRLLRDLRPAVVNSALFDSDVLARTAAAGHPSAVVTSLVNTPYDPARALDPNVTRWRLAATRAVDGWTARQLTESFHAISDTVKRHAVDRLGVPEARITVVPRGRDRTRLGEPGAERRATVRRALGWEADELVVLNVARQEFQKGQIHLIEAMPRLLERHPRARLVVAGRTGHATPQLRGALESSRAGDRIDFLGHRNDVPDLLAAADVFAFPSLYEGLGCALLEAMALEVPVVATDLPVLREVVEPGVSGALVQPADPVALAAGIDGLLDDDGFRRRLATAARHRFEERFTLQACADGMVELFERAAPAEVSGAAR